MSGSKPPNKPPYPSTEGGKLYPSTGGHHPTNVKPPYPSAEGLPHPWAEGLAAPAPVAAAPPAGNAAAPPPPPRPAPTKPWPQRYWREIVTFVSLAIGLVSLIGWLHDRPKRDLVYFQNPSSAIIVQAGAVSRLATTYDGQPVITDITATQVAIWNLGNLGVGPEDILSPIVLEVQGGLPVLEATVRDANRPDVISATLDMHDQSKGTVGVSWRYMEPHDGISVQIVYAGKPGASVTVKGVLKGEKEIRAAVPPEHHSTVPRTVWGGADAKEVSWQVLEAIGAVVVLLAGVEGIGGWLVRRRKMTDKNRHGLQAAMYLLVVVGMMAWSAMRGDSGPPFPF